MFTRDIHSHQETTEAAVYDLNQSILLCRRQKEKLLCVIVGYGSKGKTHKIQSAVLEILKEYKACHKIKDYILRSHLDIFCVEYQNFKYKDLIPKQEMQHRNPGAVYIVV